MLPVKNLNPTNLGPTGTTPPAQQISHIGTSAQGDDPPMFIPDFSQYAFVLPPSMDLHTWYYQQTVLTAAYNKACVDTQTPGGPTPEPYTPVARILQYEGMAPTNPASRDRCDARGSS
ncbi:hypothetical protein Hanom_Chr07g00615741 [Helianthus anomalus]